MLLIKKITQNEHPTAIYKQNFRGSNARNKREFTNTQQQFQLHL